MILRPCRDHRLLSEEPKPDTPPPKGPRPPRVPDGVDKNLLDTDTYARPARVPICNFERAGTEYRLGAARYTVADYLNHVSAVGFQNLKWQEYRGDERLVEEVPWATKYLGRPLLLLIRAERAV